MRSPCIRVKDAPMPPVRGRSRGLTLNFSPSVANRTSIKSGEPPCIRHGYHPLHAHAAAKLVDPLWWSREMLANV